MEPTTSGSSEAEAAAAAAAEAASSSLSFIPTCDVYDRFLEHARIPSLTWRSFGPIPQFCGYAVTVECRQEDNSRLKELVETTTTSSYQMSLLLPSHSRRRNVLVVDGGGSMRCALLGDRLAAQASAQNQWAGIVIYGCVRDVDILVRSTTDDNIGIDIGIVALGCTPRKSIRCRQGEGQVNVPFWIGDVLVHPGDAVFVDSDGVVFLDPSLLLPQPSA